jgi:hypothetical protein
MKDRIIYLSITTLMLLKSDQVCLLSAASHFHLFFNSFGYYYINIQYGGKDFFFIVRKANFFKGQNSALGFSFRLLEDDICQLFSYRMICGCLVRVIFR